MPKQYDKLAFIEYITEDEFESRDAMKMQYSLIIEYTIYRGGA